MSKRRYLLDLRAVAYNTTGPVLPQAMRVIRYSPQQLDPEQGCLSVKPWAETDPISPITGEEARKLTENAAVVASLEDLFSSRHVYFAIASSRNITCLSIRHKDRTSQTSKLDSAESERFRCGVYRLMLFSQAFPISEVEIDEEDSEEKARIRLQRTRFLEEFPNYELLTMHSVALFLAELVEWTENTRPSIHFVAAVI